MLLQNNGRFSAKKGTRHVAIRYFFISNRIEKKDICVVYCPTEEMIADYFTKPLQGALFRKFRNLVLGIREEDYDQYKQMYQETLIEYVLIDQMKPD